MVGSVPTSAASAPTRDEVGEETLRPILAVIPALNEEATVASVVASVRELLQADVVVIDDGSTDRTVAVAREAGAMVLSHPFNLGVGAALRTGFRYAATVGYDAVVQVDADGQHEVADAKRLVEEVTQHGADLAVGSRFASQAGYRVSMGRRLTMRLLSRYLSRYVGVTLTDTTSGFRAFSARAVEEFAASYPSAYLSDTVEALLLAKDWGLEVRELPVQMHDRQGGAPSAGSLRSVGHLFRLFLVIALHRVRRPLPRRGGFHR